jgi:PAS domain S-box-containing protein
MPEDDDDSFQARFDIEDLVDIEALEELLSAFYTAMGICASLISIEGRVLAGVGWQRVCTDFHRRLPASKRMCLENDVRMTRELRRNCRETIRRCPHGLMVAAVPILINDRHMASLISGEFLTNPLDADMMAEFKTRAHRFGFDEQDYLAVLSSVPIIPETQVPHILQFLKRFAEMIAEMGLQQMQLKQREQALATAHAQLKETARRQAAETRWLNQTIESNPIPTFVINALCQVTHWNRACELLTDIPASKIIGTDKHREAFYPLRRRLMVDLIVENASVHDVAMLYGKKYHSSLMVEGGYEGEDFFPHFGKHGKWLFFSAAPLKDTKGRIIGAIETLQDITARRLAEIELRASEARYHQLFESANDAILIIKNGVIVDCNQEALNLTGVSRKALVGRTPLDFSPEIQPGGTPSEALLAEKTAIAFQDRPQRFDWRIRGNNGTLIDVEVSLTRFKIGDDPHGLAIVRDVSERKKMVQALEAREHELNEKTRYLEKVNQALNASLDYREIEKRSVEEHLLMNLKRFVYPYLDELQECRLEVDAKAYVNIISTHLNDLTAQVSKTLSAKYMNLTPTEIRIADLIRDGKSTKEIAALLSLSPSSIQWHRKNIREKLGLTHQKVNLRTYLASLGE